MQAFGHMPSRNEKVVINEYTFRVLYSDSRQIHLLRVNKVKKEGKKGKLIETKKPSDTST